MPDDIRFTLLQYYYGTLQAHSKSQKVYLLSLTVFLVYAWVSFFFGGDEVLNPEWVNVRVTKPILIAVAPVVVAGLLFGLMGAIRKTGELHGKIEELAEATGLSKDSVDLHAIDLHPNLLDYIAAVWGRAPSQLLYPVVEILGVSSIVGMGAITAFRHAAVGIRLQLVIFLSYLVMGLWVYSYCHRWIVERVRKMRSSSR
jgi:hypothetical protein